MGSRHGHALAAAMNRLYERGLTTISGGNISCRDDHGVMWITPGGVDKGTITGDDIIAVHPDGSISGRHRPSLETAFHARLYEVRDDIKAVIHAHAPSLSSFCIARIPPDTACFPQIFQECGKAVMSGYKMPGSRDLAEAIAVQAAEGAHIILLDNHGALAVGGSLQQALQRFEAVDVCAASLCYGTLTGLPGSVLPQNARDLLFRQVPHASDVREYKDLYPEKRAELISICSRAYRRGLMTSSLGSCSLRTGADAFIITPQGHDRSALEPSQLAHVREGEPFGLASPDIWYAVHQAVYRACPDVHALVLSSAPAVLAFAGTQTVHDTRTLTEGYMILGTIPQVPMQEALSDSGTLPSLIRKRSPAVLISHCGLLASGDTLLQALDRVEVAEAGMRAELWARQLGNVTRLTGDELKAMDRSFHLR